MRNRRLLFIGFSLSFVYWLLNFLVAYFIFLSFSVEISFLYVIVAMNIANFVGTFSPVPGGIGLIETASVVTYSLLGVPLSIAIAVSVLTRIIFYFFSLFLGGLSLIHLEHSDV